MRTSPFCFFQDLPQSIPVYNTIYETGQKTKAIVLVIRVNETWNGVYSRSPPFFPRSPYIFRSSRWFLSYICPAMPPFRLSSLYLLLSSPLRLWPPAQFRFRPLRFPASRHPALSPRTSRTSPPSPPSSLSTPRFEHSFRLPALLSGAAVFPCASFRDTTSTSLPKYVRAHLSNSLSIFLQAPFSPSLLLKLFSVLLYLYISLYRRATLVISSRR